MTSAPFLHEIPLRLRALSREMQQLAVDMDYLGGLGEMGDKGRELFGAAGIALQWADSIESESAEGRK